MLRSLVSLGSPIQAFQPSRGEDCTDKRPAGSVSACGVSKTSTRSAKGMKARTVVLKSLVAATGQQVHYPVCGLIIGAQTNGSRLIPDTTAKKSGSPKLR